MALGKFRNRKQAQGVEEKILDVDASMHGNLTFRDPVNLRINGKFEGILESRGSLIIAETASVDAQIKGDDITVAGRFKGNIIAGNKIIVKSSAVVQGEIKAAKLVVEEGALFEGTCKMLQDIFNIDELAKYLEIEKSLILEWINQQRIPVFKENGEWLFERKSIDEWIAQEKI